MVRELRSYLLAVHAVRGGKVGAGYKRDIEARDGLILDLYSISMGWVRGRMNESR